KEGDEVLISTMEHHSNIVPWKMLCDEKKAILKVIPLQDNGELDQEAYAELLTDKTKIVGIMHVSNALGTINPVKEMIALAHERNIPVLVDGAQAVPHITVDVQDLDCDFYALSGHKMYGPTGVGVLYGKKELLEEMPPYRGGGDMILSVSFDEIIYNRIPHKFEAGTPGIAQVIGIAKAAEYLMDKGRDKLYAYESDLLQYATGKLSEIKGVRIIGTAKNKASVISFIIEGVHPHDIGTILDQEGIAVRTGHHCAQPVMERYNIPATTRASFAFYNTTEEVDKLVEGINTVIEIFT
ncbi:MAG: cysteine desulfurase, partial [Balneolales bacterium]